MKNLTVGTIVKIITVIGIILNFIAYARMRGRWPYAEEHPDVWDIITGAIIIPTIIIFCMVWICWFIVENWDKRIFK